MKFGNLKRECLYWKIEKINFWYCFSDEYFFLNTSADSSGEVKFAKKKKRKTPNFRQTLKSGQKLVFLLFSQICFFSFPLNCIGW